MVKSNKIFYRKAQQLLKRNNDKSRIWNSPKICALAKSVRTEEKSFKAKSKTSKKERRKKEKKTNFLNKYMNLTFTFYML